MPQGRRGERYLVFVQTLPTQLLFPLHTMPQPPQLELSVVVSIHAPEQRVRPALQAVPHPLLVQVAVPLGTLGHVVPHPPQLLMSLLVSTQTLPQRINGSVHWKPQVPVQTGIAFGGAVQAVPHLPQFDVSLLRLTHEPLQLVWLPHSVVHDPALHTVPAPQTVAQLPQWLLSDCRSMQELPQTV
jgi:hypothetical protein